MTQHPAQEMTQQPAQQTMCPCPVERRPPGTLR
jgi:hypothetical protein